MSKLKRETIGPEQKGQQGVTFKKGALHQQLDVPQGEKIPAKKMAAAAAGKYGPLAERRAHFAQGMLKEGRETALSNTDKSRKKS